MKKGMLAFALAAVLVLALLPVPARAAQSGTWGDNITWSFDAGTGTLTLSGSGAMPRGISAPWPRENVVHIVVKEGITATSKDCFQYHDALTSVSLPSTLTEIYSGTFSQCTKLESINLPDGLLTIGSDAFSSCSALKDIQLPDSLTEIRNFAFYACSSLESIQLPEALTVLDYGAFYNCTSLSGTVTIPEGITTIARQLFCRCEKLSGVVLHDQIDMIEECAFEGTGLTTVDLPERLVFLGALAFAETKLTTVHIPKRTLCLDWSNYGNGSPFANCPNLTAIDVAEGNTSHKTDAQGVLYNKDMTAVLQVPGAFSGTLVIPEGVAELGGFSSMASKMTAIHLPTTITHIGFWAFHGCNELKEVTFAGEKPEITAEAFEETAVLTFFYPDWLDSWENPEFEDMSATVTYVSYPKPIDNPFTDVKAGEWYADPVFWAIEKGITNGVTPTTFAPDDTCSRDQIATFLWRANGCPEPASSNNPFTDVKNDQWYTKAVLWALEKGITTGATATTFGTEDPCERAAVVTFLWRAFGCPEPTTTKHPFTDADANAWYGKAMLWAVENGITSGITATTFGPTQTCTRAQIVTFLYRAFK